MEKDIARDEGVSIRRHLLGGVVIALMLTVGVGGWATTTELSGAVIAPGSMVVDSNVKKVQHLTGGIVGELLVRDGAARSQRRGRAAARRDHHAGQSRHRHQGSRRDERAPGPARERARPDRAKSPSRAACWRAQTSPTSRLPSTANASCSSCGAAPGSARSRSSGSASPSSTRKSAGTRPCRRQKRRRSS